MPISNNRMSYFARCVSVRENRGGADNRTAYIPARNVNLTDELERFVLARIEKRPLPGRQPCGPRRAAEIGTRGAADVFARVRQTFKLPAQPDRRRVSFFPPCRSRFTNLTEHWRLYPPAMGDRSNGSLPRRVGSLLPATGQQFHVGAFPRQYPPWPISAGARQHVIFFRREPGGSNLAYPSRTNAARETFLRG